MNLTERIVCDPGILAGKPIVKGTRISVEFILKMLSQGISFEEILREYPGLNVEDILATIAYASETVAAEEIHHFGRVPEGI